MSEKSSILRRVAVASGPPPTMSVGSGGVICLQTTRAMPRRANATTLAASHARAAIATGTAPTGVTARKTDKSPVREQRQLCAVAPRDPCADDDRGFRRSRPAPARDALTLSAPSADGEIDCAVRRERGACGRLLHRHEPAKQFPRADVTDAAERAAGLTQRSLGGGEHLLDEARHAARARQVTRESEPRVDVASEWRHAVQLVAWTPERHELPISGTREIEDAHLRVGAADVGDGHAAVPEL